MKNKKLIVYRILLILLIIAAIVIGSMIFHKQYEDKVYDNENKEIVELFHQKEKENSKDDKEKKKIDLEYKGHKVIGLIEIPAIDLEYPILEKTTKLAMRTSISRYYGGEINEYGNVSLAGHNNYSGTMFGKNKNLKLGDKVLLTDLRRNNFRIRDI